MTLLVLDLLFKTQEALYGINLTLVGIRYGMHATTTIPKFDFIASSRSKVYIQICLKGERFDTINLTLMSCDNLGFDIIELLNFYLVLAKIYMITVIY